MKRRVIALSLLAGALLIPSVAHAQVSCTSTGIGSSTFTNCYDVNGGTAIGTSTRIGDSTFTNVSGYGNDGQTYTGSATSTRIGPSTFTTYDIYP